jgi:hypothetical protein
MIKTTLFTFLLVLASCQVSRTASDPKAIQCELVSWRILGRSGFISRVQLDLTTPARDTVHFITDKWPGAIRRLYAGQKYTLHYQARHNANPCDTVSGILKPNH